MSQQTKKKYVLQNKTLIACYFNSTLQFLQHPALIKQMIYCVNKHINCKKYVDIAEYIPKDKSNVKVPCRFCAWLPVYKWIIQLQQGKINTIEYIMSAVITNIKKAYEHCGNQFDSLNPKDMNDPDDLLKEILTVLKIELQKYKVKCCTSFKKKQTWCCANKNCDYASNETTFQNVCYSHSINIQDNFSDTMEEISYNCPNCDCNKGVCTVAPIDVPPSLLILHLGLTKWDKDLQRQILIDDTIKLTEKITVLQEQYQIFNIINRRGASYHTGHYTTFVRQQNKFLHINDDQITIKTKQDIFTDWYVPLANNTNNSPGILIPIILNILVK